MTAPLDRRRALCTSHAQRDDSSEPAADAGSARAGQKAMALQFATRAAAAGGAESAEGVARALL
jgi:hypothetical protein